MAQKRKVEVTTDIDDESDRVLYSVFRSAAAGLSHLYSQALNHHKVAFEAGQRHALHDLKRMLEEKRLGTENLENEEGKESDAKGEEIREKLNEWMTVKHQEGTVVTIADISAYLQNELNSISLPSNALHGRQNEADLSFSTSLMQSQDRDENAFCSISSEMEIEESPH